MRSWWLPRGSRRTAPVLLALELLVALGQLAYGLPVMLVPPLAAELLTHRKAAEARTARRTVVLSLTAAPFKAESPQGDSTLPPRRGNSTRLQGLALGGARNPP